jgi:hypothetical protein
MEDLKTVSQSHDQNYKNLILDYPREAIAFFAPQEARHVNDDVEFIPIRQEQLKERLGDRFRELDTPLLLQWPDGKREAIIFLFEEESIASQFSISRYIHYCVDIYELFKTTRIIPVVIFLRSGQYPLELKLGSDLYTFLSFRYIACDLAKMNAADHLQSDNIVARLNLPLMCYNKSEKVDIYAHAVDGLVSLEDRQQYQLKYIEFIDQYANLSTSELEQFQTVYINNSNEKGNNMGLVQYLHDQGMQQGMQQGGKDILHYQIKKKFGALSTEQETQLEQANSELLLQWSDKILSANSINDIFR